MFGNLNAEMSRIGLTVKEMYKEIPHMKSYDTLRNRFNGKAQFTLEDMTFIKNRWFPQFTLDYLFEKTQQKLA